METKSVRFIKRVFAYLSILILAPMFWFSCNFFTPPGLENPPAQEAKAPVVSGISPTNTNTPTWTWTVAAGSTEVSYQLDDASGVWINQPASISSFIPAAPLSDGTHTLYVRSRIGSGAWSKTASREIIVDTVPPASPIVSVDPLPDIRTPLWSWNLPAGSPSDATKFRYQLDAETADGWNEVGGGVTSFRPAGQLDVSPHTFFVQSGDAAGNWSISALSSIDINPNAPFVTGPSLTGSAQPTWTWTVSSEVIESGYQLDGTTGAWVIVSAGVTSYTPESALSDGAHTLYVRARTTGAWSEPSSCTITIDATPPAAPVVSGETPTVEPRPTWTWTLPTDATSGVVSLRYALDNDPWTMVGTGTFSYTLPFDMDDAHILSVQACDAAGNWSASGSLLIEVLWHLETVDARSSSVGHSVDMDLEADGSPVICYIDTTTASILCAGWNGTGWGFETIDTGGLRFLALGVDQYGNRDVVYTDASEKVVKTSHFDEFKQKHVDRAIEGRDIEAWTKVTGLHARLDTAGHLNIALSRVKKDSTENDLFYNSFSGGNPPDPTDSFFIRANFPNWDTGWSPSITSVNTGRMRVAFITATGVRMGEWLDEVWKDPGVTVSTVFLTETCDTRIIIDSSSMTGIAYSTPTGEIWYAKENGAAFDLQRAREASAQPLGSFSLAYDAVRARPVLVSIEGSELWCSTLVGTAWVRELVDTGVGDRTAVSVDASGRVLIAYHDSVNGTLKFARRAVSAP